MGSQRVRHGLATKNCIYIFFIHSSVNGHVDCFHILAVVNSAAINTGVHVFELEFSSFPDICPGVGLLDHMATLFSDVYSK